MLSNPRLRALLLFAAFPGPLVAADPGLLGHWPLAGDVRDVSGHGLHGVNRGADLTAHGPDGRAGGAARFNGRDAQVEIPHHPSLNLGKGDFSLTARVHTATELDDVLGDLLSRYDSVRRTGFTWCLKNSPGSTTSQANYRQLQFGIDAGTEPQWRDCGRPGEAVYIMALATHDGALYAGTCEPGPDQAGHVYRYDGTAWTDLGRPDRCNAVTALAAFDGRLYAGVGRYRLAGSSLPESTNPHPGGAVYRHDGGQPWTPCGRLPGAEAIGGLVVYRGKLHASSLYRPAGCHRYVGGDRWEALPIPAGGERVDALGVFNGFLWATSYDGCAVFRRAAGPWERIGTLEPTGQTYALEVHNGELFVATWPNGRVYRHARGEAWVDAGRLGEEKEVMGMAVYNGKLYGGTLPLAEVHRYDGDGQWRRTGQLDRTPDVRYRRAWTMAVFQGQLFCGTLPSGRVHAMRTGAVVTHDRELAPGWRHVAAVRRGGMLRLYVDGTRVAESAASNAAALDVSCARPLLLGRGPHDGFNGSLCDVRLYGRALEDREVAALAGR